MTTSLLLSLIALSAQPGGEPTGFLNKVSVVDGEARKYVLYVPADYTAEKEWPLVMFLHGAGERGDDGLIQTEVGIGTAIRRQPSMFPCLVLMPQCPEEAFWDSILGHLEQSLADTRANYNVDGKRIYLTGLSMGGYGTWIWGAQKTDTFAALMPVCGGGKPSDMQRLCKEPIADVFGTLKERVAKLATVPIWAFHGEADKTVPPFRTSQMVRLVKEAGGNVKHTTYPEVGHDSWNEAYQEPLTWFWLFRQARVVAAV
jgi:predicted peptidase